MSQAMVRPCHALRASVLLPLLWVAGGGGPAHAGGKEPLPYDLDVRVSFEEGSSESPELVDMLRFVLASEVDAQRCMRSVRVLDPEQPLTGDLLLRVRLSDLEAGTEHLLSIAKQAADPTNPDTRQAYIARFEVDVHLELIALPSGLIVRETRFREIASRQPQNPWEDAHEEVRRQAVEDMIRVSRKKLCGSPGKLQKRIERARQQAAAAD